MFLQLNYYAPTYRPNPLMRWSLPHSAFQAPAGPQESYNFSAQANLWMMVQAMRGVMSGFYGGVGLGSNANFGAFRGLPGGNHMGFGGAPFGPIKCSFGPPNKRPKVAKPSGATVKPLRQGNSISCGQTSVAMAVNSLTGKKLTDTDINRSHGFNLLPALRRESRSAGYTWSDGGNFRTKDWKLIEKKLNTEKTPVIMGLNGPTFSPSGRGHIVTLLSVNGDKVKYADPADGKIKTVSRRTIETAPGHPHGKFFFYASKA